jgi:hypothetical protein
VRCSRTTAPTSKCLQPAGLQRSQPGRYHQRTVKVRALFDTVDNALFPNQIVDVQLLMKTPHNVVTVPTAAAAHGGVTSTSSTPITGCRSDRSISARLMAQWQRSIPACRPATGCARRRRPLARQRACDHAERHRAKRRQQIPRRTRRILSRFVSLSDRMHCIHARTMSKSLRAVGLRYALKRTAPRPLFRP